MNLGEAAVPKFFQGLVEHVEDDFAVGFDFLSDHLLGHRECESDQIAFDFLGHIDFERFKSLNRVLVLQAQFTYFFVHASSSFSSKEAIAFDKARFFNFLTAGFGIADQGVCLSPCFVEKFAGRLDGIPIRIKLEVKVFEY